MESRKIKDIKKTKVLEKKATIYKNISYTLSSNVLAFAVATVVTLFVPKFIGIESYGYFQLYVFYSSYIGFLHFGWADGLYLRYGGAYYSELDRNRISAQFWLLVFFEFIISVAICLVIARLNLTESKQIVVGLTVSTIVLVISRTMLQFMLQCTNRIREYSAVVITERIVYLFFVIACILTGQKEFYMYIFADIAGKIIALIVAVMYCKEIVLCRPEKIECAIIETYNNVSVGIKLMLSNIAGMLIIGIVRYSIEHQWDVSTFGKVSLSLSVSNMLLVLVNAVSLAMFPALRRMDPKNYSSIYKRLRTTLTILLLGMLILYYPIKAILSLWLPQYSDSLKYMAILFPMCIFESKNSMLVTTYMKALRKEMMLLIINVISMALSFIFTWVAAFQLKNLEATVLTIVVLIAFRSILGELYLQKDLDLRVTNDIILEIALTIIFISASWKVGGLAGMGIYAISYAGYLLIKKKELMHLLQTVHIIKN